MDLATIKLSVDHVFKSGANEVRIMDLIECILPRWIDVKANLPEVGDEVQVVYRYDDGEKWEVGKGFLNFIGPDGELYWMGYDCIGIQVCKWAPFLELPSELK